MCKRWWRSEQGACTHRYYESYGEIKRVITAAEETVMCRVEATQSVKEYLERRPRELLIDIIISITS